MGTREHQLELEAIYDKNQLMPRVRQAFRDCTSIDFRSMMEKQHLEEDFGFDVLAQIAVHRRADVRTMVGCLRHHCESAQEAAFALERAVQAELLTFSGWTMGANGTLESQLIVKYEIGESLQAELDMFQYPLPMVVEPRELHHNLDSGYLTGKSSVILRDNHTNDDVCLDHLNRVNKTPFSLNLEVAKTIQNKWSGLDKKHPDESYEDFHKRQRAFEKYDRVAKQVLEILLLEGNRIYFTHKYDKRGRTYCSGFHVNYQGTDWNKAIIEFADKETIK